MLCSYGAQVSASTEVFVDLKAVVSPFHLAIYAGSVESVAALCQHASSGINVPTIPPYALAVPSLTPLDFLTDCICLPENKLLTIAQLLLNTSGIAPTINPERAIHLLFECCRSGYYQLLKYLLGLRGEMINLNYVHPWAGGTLLHLIIKDQRLTTDAKIDLITSLTTAGADVNTPPVAGHQTATDVGFAILIDDTLKSYLLSLGMRL